MTAALGLIVGTFVSEDLACVTAGVLIQRGELNPAVGIVACALGILLGDWALWLLGRLGRVTATKWFLDKFPSVQAEHVRSTLDRHAPSAIVASRFLPGTRVGLYLTAGFAGMPLFRFVLWTSIAVMLWTPAFVLLSARSIDVIPGLTGAVALLAAVHSARLVATRARRRRISARLSRLMRWEFWPMWLFYGPVAAWVSLLAIRYRGLTTMTAANPGIADGGVVGESKFEILSRLPADCVIPSALIPAGHIGERVTRFVDVMQRNDWRFPIVIKPDVGQRGTGVRVIRNNKSAIAYLERSTEAVILQPYHEGPYEAGIFYVRKPGEERGRIFSITDKLFPVIVGDGCSTVQDLIWSHPRYRMQAALFLGRHADIADRVLERGERLQLAVAGNHAQGTMFRDGRHLLTPQLEARIDEISRAYPGFFVGRFDVRYKDTEAFKQGLDLAIVELNGATAESTNIYDPDKSLLAAYRVLFRQWALVFEIGWANRTNGASVTSRRRLVELVRAHLTSRVEFAVSD